MSAAHAYTEDQLVEQPAIGLFAELGWATVSASEEIFGAAGTLCRETKGEVVLAAKLRAALTKLNPALPPEAIAAAVDELIRDRSTMLLEQANREVYGLLKDGIKVSVPDRDNGGQKTERLRVVDWENPSNNDFLLVSQFSVTGQLYTCRPDLVGFVNWTMLPYMSDIWAAIQSDLLPGLLGERRKIFFDLADPEKRTPADIQRALDLIVRFQSRFDVILGLNEKEAYEIARVLGLDPSPRDAQGLAQLAIDIQKRVAVETLVVHPVAYALTVSNGKADLVEGSVCRKPTITTGAGDHFNSGFCLGRLLGLSNADSLLCGVSTSGHYVRSAESPRVADLSRFMRNWPTE